MAEENGNLTSLVNCMVDWVKPPLVCQLWGLEHGELMRTTVAASKKIKTGEIWYFTIYMTNKDPWLSLYFS